MLFVCYPKCTTCKKAQKWLDDRGKAYEVRDIKLQNPTAEELKEWHKKSGLPLKKFFNTSGMLYREMKLSEGHVGGRDDKASVHGRHAGEAPHRGGRGYRPGGI